MVIKVFYRCSIDNKDILDLDLDRGGIAIRECDHVFGYMVPPSDPAREDEICPKQFRIKTWSTAGWKYGVCVQSNASSKYVVRDIKKLKKILGELLNYREDQIIYFILDGFAPKQIIYMIKDMIKDMFVGYKVDDEFLTPKSITVVGVLNKVTIYFL